MPVRRSKLLVLALAIALSVFTACDSLPFGGDPVTLTFDRRDTVQWIADGLYARCSFDMQVSASSGNGHAQMDSIVVEHFYPESGNNVERAILRTDYIERVWGTRQVEPQSRIEAWDGEKLLTQDLWDSTWRLIYTSSDDGRTRSTKHTITCVPPSE